MSVFGEFAAIRKCAFALIHLFIHLTVLVQIPDTYESVGFFVCFVGLLIVVVVKVGRKYENFD